MSKTPIRFDRLTDVSNPGFYSNLRISNNATTPLSKLDIIANTITLTNNTGESYDIRNLSTTVDITVLGLGGRSAGSEAINTWYYIWVIGKDDMTVGAILDISSTSPTLPADYTFKHLVGTVRNNDSSNFLRYMQRNDLVLYQEVDSSRLVLNQGNATSYTNVSCGSFVPPISNIAYLDASIEQTTAGQRGGIDIRTPGLGSQHLAQSCSGAIGIPIHNNGYVVTNTSQQVEYKVDNIGLSSTQRAYIYVSGYIVNI